MDNLYDPKVLSINLAQNPRILDGCLNIGPIIESYDMYLKKDACTIYMVRKSILSSLHKTQGF